MAVDLPKITVQSEDSEEEVEAARRRRRRRTGLAELPAVLVGVAMVVVGALYRADCVYSKATLFLMIAGSVLALAALMMVLAWLTPKLNGAFEALGAVAYVGYFAVAIWGSVEIFGSFSDWESEDDLSGLYCPPTPFYAAFVSLVCFWVVMPLLFLCHCCAMCHKMTSGSAEVATIS